MKANQKQLPTRSNKDDDSKQDSFDEEEDYEVSEMEASLDADQSSAQTKAKAVPQEPPKPKEKSFKERYAEEVELADQKALAFRQRDEEAIMALKLKYLAEQNITITEKMKQIKERPNLDEPRNGRLLFIVSEQKSI